MRKATIAGGSALLIASLAACAAPAADRTSSDEVQGDVVIDTIGPDDPAPSRGEVPVPAMAPGLLTVPVSELPTRPIAIWRSEDYLDAGNWDAAQRSAADLGGLCEAYYAGGMTALDQALADGWSVSPLAAVEGIDPYMAKAAQLTVAWVECEARLEIPIPSQDTTSNPNNVMEATA